MYKKKKSILIIKKLNETTDNDAIFSFILAVISQMTNNT